MLYRPLKYLFVFLLGLLIVPVMVLPPEGAFRDGAFSISFLLWFLLLPLAVFLLAQIAGNPSLACKRADSSLPVFAVGGRNKFCIADAAVLAFLCWIIFSLIAMLARDGGNLRYAINSVSLYFFMVYVYFLIRVSRAILSPVLLLALFAAICVMCLTESFSGLYAYLIRDPAFRQSWLENSEELLRNSGMFYPEGSPERILLENRILGSSEPLGTYGLANTLAGVLLPVLVALAGLVCIAIGSTLRYRKSEAAARSTSDGNPTHCPEQPRKSLVSFFVLAFVVFAPLFCVLILTKSRTGILAFLFGCFLFVLGLILRHRFVDRSVSVPVSSGESTMAEATAESGGSQGTKSRKVSSLFVFGLVVVFLVGISIFLAFRLNIIDREVFTEAGKSLGYRLDYWRSSAAMIADYPWFGIGPGSFQTRYPSYMMPLASEVIADPHNFVFELGALFGLPALLLFLLFFVLGCPIPFLSRLNQNGWFVATGVPDRVQAPVVEDSSQKTSSRKKGRVKSQQPKLISDAGTLRVSEESQTAIPEVETRFFFVGLGLGFFLAFMFSFFTAAPFDMSFLVCGLVAFVLIVPLFISQLSGMGHGWIQNPQAARVVLRTILMCVCGAILLNFCAAGGFSYPPTAFPLWTGLGILVNDSVSSSSNSNKAKQRHSNFSTSFFAYCAIPFLLVIPIVFYFVAFLPACRGEAFARDCRDKMIRDDLPQLEILSDFPQAMEKVDPYSIAVAQLYYEIAASAYAQVANYRTYNYWRQTREHLLAISPLSSSVCDVIGSKELDLCKEFKTDKLLPSACDILKDAVRLAPYDAKKHAFLAIALEMSGKHAEAIHWGTKALELDKATPHVDRKLIKPVREEVEKIVAVTTSPPKQPTK